MKNLVLTSASTYDYETLRPFFDSLKSTNFNGDAILFLGEHDKYTYSKLRDKFPIEIIRYTDEYPYFIDRSELNKKLVPEPDFTPHPKTLRYLLYQAFLKYHPDKYDFILTADSRDVAFQKNPFEFEPKKVLYAFEEDGSQSIEDNYYNSLWIREAFGQKYLDEIGSKRILCSGVTIGHVKPFMNYLNVMIEYILKVKDQGCKDQGIHNFVLHTGKFKDVHIYQDDVGPVSTISYFKPKSKIRINNKNLVLDVNGEPISIVHQYDRVLKLLKHYSFRNYAQRRIGLFKKKYYSTFKKLTGNE